MTRKIVTEDLRESTRGAEEYFTATSSTDLVDSGHIPLAYRSNPESMALRTHMDRVVDRSLGDRGFAETREDMYSS